LADYVPLRGIYPVGRLDYDSEGLLLLTDDGPLQHRLADPKFEHPRTYWAQVEGAVTTSALDLLRLGVQIQGYLARAREAELIAEPSLPERVPPIRRRLHIPTSWIELTLTEGRNRQVRRMTAAAGFPTLRLIRTAFGPLTINGLAPGAWRDLAPHELRSLKGLARAAGNVRS
jgi:23S rRNA pseudouridine2457 synthase